jgi:hypothetical protein
MVSGGRVGGGHAAEDAQGAGKGVGGRPIHLPTPPRVNPAPTKKEKGPAPGPAKARLGPPPLTSAHPPTHPVQDPPTALAGGGGGADSGGGGCTTPPPPPPPLPLSPGLAALVASLASSPAALHGLDDGDLTQCGGGGDGDGTDPLASLSPPPFPLGGPHPPTQPCCPPGLSAWSADGGRSETCCGGFGCSTFVPDPDGRRCSEGGRHAAGASSDGGTAEALPAPAAAAWCRPAPHRPPASPSSAAAMRAEVSALLAAAAAAPPPPVPASAPSPADTARLEDAARVLASRLGPSHLQVGKAWLLLARAYHARRGVDDGADAAAEGALARAYAVCSAHLGGEGGGGGGGGVSGGGGGGRATSFIPTDAPPCPGPSSSGLDVMPEGPAVRGGGAEGVVVVEEGRGCGAGVPPPPKALSTPASGGGVRKSRSGKRKPGLPRLRGKKGRAMDGVVGT